MTSQTWPTAVVLFLAHRCCTCCLLTMKHWQSIYVRCLFAVRGGEFEAENSQDRSMFPVWVHGSTRRWWTLMLQVQFAIKIAFPHAHGMEICPVPSYRNSTMVFINYKFLAETYLAFWNICISYFIKTSSWKVWKLSLYQHTGCLQNMSRASYCLDHTLTHNFEDWIVQQANQQLEVVHCIKGISRNVSMSHWAGAGSDQLIVSVLHFYPSVWKTHFPLFDFSWDAPSFGGSHNSSFRQL